MSTSDPGAEGRRAAWRAERREAAAVHAAAHERRRAAEAAQAAALLADFVAAATERGLIPEPLRAKPYGGGRARYRTNVEGWYLRVDHTVAVGRDGAFYLLTVPPSLLARFRGVTLEAREPRLVVGEGGRDGDTVPLKDLLAARLADHLPP